MLIDKNRHKESLTELWNRVFGDEQSFIELIFNEKYNESILCFAEITDEKAVSAFYLIKNELRYNGELYNGYYLYAAATLPEFRGRGYMSELIRKAQQFFRENNKADFISLVPSEKSLYGYYSSLGFQTAMYRFINGRTSSAVCSSSYKEIESPEEILDIRRKYKGNSINFSCDSFGYALDCMKHSGFKLLSTGADIILIDSDDADSFSELVAPDADTASHFAKGIDLKGDLTSPFFLDEYSENEAVPYGMLYPINKKLVRDWKFTDIYMNVALD